MNVAPEARAALCFAALAVLGALARMRRPGVAWVVLASAAPLAGDLVQLGGVSPRASLAVYCAARALGAAGVCRALGARSWSPVVAGAGLAAWCTIAPCPGSWWGAIVTAAPIVAATFEIVGAVSWTRGPRPLSTAARAALVYAVGDACGAVLALAIPRSWAHLAILSGMVSASVLAALARRES